MKREIGQSRAGLRVAQMLLLAAGLWHAPNLAADPELVAGEPVFGFGSDWFYVDGGQALEAALPQVGGGLVEGLGEAWPVGTSPFVARSSTTQDEIERQQRQRRRRGRSSSSFTGTLMVYDTAAFGVPPGAAQDYQAGPNRYLFAREFEVEDLASVASIFFEVRFSGGFVAYLNGTEWLRDNVDPGSAADAPADIHWLQEWVAQTVGNVWQRAYVGVDPRLLREGTNELVVEVRRRGNGGVMSAYFDAQLRVFRERGFIRTPYLQELGTESVTVMWETSVPTVGYVEFGAGDWLERVATAPRMAASQQEVTLVGLEPDTRYFYRVHSLDPGGEPISSPIYHFRTAVEAGSSFTFIAYGDNRTNSDRHAALVQSMLSNAERNDVRFFINTGDLTTHGSWWDEWQDEFFEPALPMLAYYPMYAVLGNHEGNHETFYEYLSQPGNEAWYHFRSGDADFFGINSSADFSPGSAQHAFLEQALAASDAAWQIAFMHHPAYSCVASRKPGNEYVISYLVPLFEQYGVDLVLVGHDHLYGRSALLNGVTYVITGGGGAGTYPADPDEINPICIERHHYCTLRVSPTAIDLEAVTPEGELLDSFTLSH